MSERIAVDAAEYDVVELNPEAVKLGLTQPAIPPKTLPTATKQGLPTAISSDPPAPPPSNPDTTLETARAPLATELATTTTITEQTDGCVTDPPPTSSSQTADPREDTQTPPDSQTVPATQQRPNNRPAEQPETRRNDDGPEPFGIAYRKIAVPGEDDSTYELPSHEFEEVDVEHLGSIAGQTLAASAEDDDDDEFDYDGVASTPAPVQQADVAASAEATLADMETQGSLAMQKLHQQYAAGLSDAAVLQKDAERAELEAKALDMNQPLGALMEEDDEEEGEEEEEKERNENVDDAGNEGDDQQDVEGVANAHGTPDSRRQGRPNEVPRLARAPSDSAPSGSSVSSTAIVSSSQRQILANEWAEIERHQQKNLGNDVQVSNTTCTFDEGIAYLLSPRANLQQYRMEITPTKHEKSQGLFAKLSKACFGHPSLGEALVDERDTVFMVAKVPLDNTVPELAAMMQTVFKSISGNAHDCPPTGSHWTSIGFQGNDPATDLRAVGMLGILQVIWCLEKQHTLMLQIHSLSHDPVQKFPMMSVSLNLSLTVLQCLRNGSLNKLCNKRGTVWGVVNTLLLSLWFKFLGAWKRRNYTIADFGEVLMAFQSVSQGSPDAIIHEFESSEQRAQAKGEALTAKESFVAL